MRVLSQNKKNANKCKPNTKKYILRKMCLFWKGNDLRKYVFICFASPMWKIILRGRRRFYTLKEELKLAAPRTNILPGTIFHI